jgi:hypothetical protein
MAARANTTTAKQPAARSDAYTGLLLISLLAQLVGVLFFYLDWSQYPTSKPQEPPGLTAAAGGPRPGGPAPAPAPPPAPPKK